MAKWTLDDFKDEPLVRRKKCTKNHHLPDGSNPKYTRKTEGRLPAYRCVACRCNLPIGVYEYAFTNLSDPAIPPGQKYFTDEEKKAARVRSQMEWNNRNKEKCKGYMKKYISSEKKREARLKAYREMSPEKKAEFLAKNRERNRLKKLLKEQDENN